MIRMTDRNNIRAIAVFLFSGFFCLYLSTVPDRLPEGDEAILLGVADRIARFGFSWLPPGVNETSRFSSYGFYADGFSKYGLGQSLLLIPSSQWYRKAKTAMNERDYYFYVLLTFIPGPLIGAGVVTLVFLIISKLGYRDRTGFTLSLVLGLTTMIWPYTQTIFSDPTLGLLWLLAFYLILSYRKSGKLSLVALSGFCVGFSVLDKIVAVYAVPIFIVYFLNILYEKNPRDDEPPSSTIIPLSAFLLPIALMGFAALEYNRLRYGSWFAFGYLDSRTYDKRDTMFGFNVPLLAGFYAQLFSSGKGFFFYNPSVLIGLIGWNRFYFRHRAEALFILALTVSMVLIYSQWYGWHGDWSWGLRYLSCLPAFVLLLGTPVMEALLEDGEAILPRLVWKKSIAVLLVAVSLTVQIPGLCIRSMDYIITASDVKIFQGNFFGDKWVVRDDSMQMHFIPEFSPLAGHWWMMRVIRNRGDNTEFQKVFRSPPWISLNVDWELKEMDPRLFRYHIWWMNILAGNKQVVARWIWFAGLLGVGFLVCVTLGWRRCCLRPR